MEQRIRDLCTELLDTGDPLAAQRIANDLRSAIHDHIENLRLKVLQIPALLPGDLPFDHG